MASQDNVEKTQTDLNARQEELDAELQEVSSTQNTECLSLFGARDYLFQCCATSLEGGRLHPTPTAFAVVIHTVRV